MTYAQEGQMHLRERIPHSFNLDLYRNLDFSDFAYDPMNTQKNIVKEIEKIIRGISDEEEIMVINAEARSICCHPALLLSVDFVMEEID
jgi:hypothetical protein